MMGVKAPPTVLGLFGGVFFFRGKGYICSTLKGTAMAKGKTTQAKRRAKTNAKQVANRTAANKAKFLKCLRASLGVVTDAVNKSKLSKTKHYDWCREDPEYKAEVDSIEEASIDFAESKLFERIRGVKIRETKVVVVNKVLRMIDMVKEYPPDTKAIMFYLSTKGKKRGYVPKFEIQKADFEDMPQAELDKLIAEYEQRHK